MAIDSTIGKIGKIDFFACLPSGTYFFLCLFLAFCMEENGENNVVSIWLALDQLISYTTDTPSLILLIIYCSYLLGSVMRALPVSFSERAVFFGKDPFPYDEEIKKLITEISQNAEISQVNTELLPPANKEFTKILYNYWKDVICVNSPDAFYNYQEFEARTRFFSGMFISGSIGVLISSFLVFKFWGQIHYPSIYLLILSILIMVAFGRNIKRVRKQEVTTLVGIYLAYVQSRHQQPENKPRFKPWRHRI